MSLDALHIILPVAGIVVGAVGGALGTYLVDRNNAESKVAKADAMVNKMIDDAQKRAETLKKETILEAKEEVYRIKNENERGNKVKCSKTIFKFGNFSASVSTRLIKAGSRSRQNSPGSSPCTQRTSPSFSIIATTGNTASKSLIPSALLVVTPAG